jgi:hypothetical protein
MAGRRRSRLPLLAVGALLVVGVVVVLLLILS